MNDLRVNTNGGKMPSYFRQPAYDNLKNFYDALDDADGRSETGRGTRRALWHKRRGTRRGPDRGALSSSGFFPTGVDRVRSALLGGCARQAAARGVSHRVACRRDRARDRILLGRSYQIGRAHVWTPVTSGYLVC